MSKPPELLAPAGNWDCVRAAVANGADAVYFGLPRFNARIRADNFSEEDLPKVVDFCHRYGVKAYVAFNTLVFTHELDDAIKALLILSRSGVDALIVQDVGLIKLARRIVPDLPIHASTQMTLTSPEGVGFARDLGVERVVLGREVSLRELAQFKADTPGSMPLEVFVHGALCVAYSGQCLTSESLGQRSANRGECAQACRMPYDLFVDGRHELLGDKRYLLSPQDLCAADHIADLIQLGVCSFKIEGRLKSAEYVAAVCQVYRKAIDSALAGCAAPVGPADRYQLEMSFSRGLFSGWMEGVNHQKLVPARFGKKRGPFAGFVSAVAKDHVEVKALTPLSAGDGVVFDTGGDTNSEQGGRIYEIRGHRLFFQHSLIDFTKIKIGHRLWKTHDPALERRLQQSCTGNIFARKRIGIAISAEGSPGTPLRLVAHLVDEPAATAEACSDTVLETARTAPLSEQRLADQIGKLKDTRYQLTTLTCNFTAPVILPIAELNRLRRKLVELLDRTRAQTAERRENPANWRDIALEAIPEKRMSGESLPPMLSVLCRDEVQIQAALECGVSEVLLDFEDLRNYRDAVALIKSESTAQVWLATPRIQKASEQGFFRLIENAAPDGILVRNLGAMDFFNRFSGPHAQKLLGDFSLNIANPITACEFLRRGLERVTVSYDLTASQVIDLTLSLPESLRDKLELTLHQHMPMFHMEHCVFAAFLSKGTSHLDCGRPCERHRVHLQDRVGVRHPLRADVGCRNTLFNAKAQTGAAFYGALFSAGIRHFRVELLEEDAAESRRVIKAYQQLLHDKEDGFSLGKKLNAIAQLGVTSGTLAARERGS
jgi:putative protease